MLAINARHMIVSHKPGQYEDNLRRRLHVMRDLGRRTGTFRANQVQA